MRFPFSRLIKRLPGIKQWSIAKWESQNLGYDRIATLPIVSSGLCEDGVPFVRLNNDRVFYGYLPTRRQRMIYRRFCDRAVQRNVDECAIDVALGIVNRYLGPQSEETHISQGKYYDLQPGNIVVEVGAFVGYYAMRASELVGPSGHVVAIEAVRENLELLKRNVEANSISNITFVHRAAWNSTGTLNVFRKTKQQASAIPGMVPSDEGADVPCDTVDNVLKEAGIERVDFVRMQINGAEWEALEGMEETLSKYPKLLVAAILQRDGQPSWKTVAPQLQKHGYTTTVTSTGQVFAQKADELSQKNHPVLH